MAEYRYFESSEFVSCTPSCSIDDMDVGFMRRLDNARHIAGVPFRLNSAFRSVDYEILHGRHLDVAGAHSTYPCCAVDISCLTSFYRLRILFALLAVGFKRIGIYPTFIHVDSDGSKPDAVWYGK